MRSLSSSDQCHWRRLTEVLSQALSSYVAKSSVADALPQQLYGRSVQVRFAQGLNKLSAQVRIGRSVGGELSMEHVYAVLGGQTGLAKSRKRAQIAEPRMSLDELERASNIAIRWCRTEPFHIENDGRYPPGSMSVPVRFVSRETIKIGWRFDA